MRDIVDSFRFDPIRSAEEKPTNQVSEEIDAGDDDDGKSSQTRRYEVRSFLLLCSYPVHPSGAEISYYSVGESPRTAKSVKRTKWGNGAVGVKNVCVLPR